MPINSINPTNKGNKKDLADQILQGLQIAEAGLKIPVAYEQIRAYGADADMKRDEQQGITTRAKLGAGGGVLIPRSEAASLTPPGGGPSPLLPSPAYYGPKGQTVRVRDGDQITEETVTTEQAKKDFFEGEAKRRSEYEGNPLTKDTSATLLAGQKALKSLSGANMGSDQIASVYNFYHAIESQSSVKDGEFKAAADASGLFEKLGNMDEQLKKGSFIGPKGQAAMKSTIKDLMDAQLKVQSILDERYAGIAKEQGYKPENVVTGHWTGKKEEKSPLPEDKAARLKELRAKAKNGTLGQ